MRAVVQRAAAAQVSVDGRLAGRIGPGLLVLAGVTHTDGEADARLLAKKVAELRIFKDENGKMNRSLLDTGGGALVVSNFTLYGDASHGRRPSFIAAARPEQASPLCDCFTAALREAGVAEVATGQFGADMVIDLTADGPVTLTLDTAVWLPRGEEAAL